MVRVVTLIHRLVRLLSNCQQWAVFYSSAPWWWLTYLSGRWFSYALTTHQLLARSRLGFDDHTSGQPESPNRNGLPFLILSQAQALPGYNAFINQRKHEVYVKDKEAGEQPPAAPEMDPDMEDTWPCPWDSMGEDYTGCRSVEEEQVEWVHQPSVTWGDRIKSQQRPAQHPHPQNITRVLNTTQNLRNRNPAPRHRAATPETHNSVGQKVTTRGTPEDREGQRKSQLLMKPLEPCGPHLTRWKWWQNSLVMMPAVFMKYH